MNKGDRARRVAFGKPHPVVVSTTIISEKMKRDCIVNISV